jgi:hypothetical protein
MRNKLFLFLMAASLVLSGCSSPAGVGITQPPVSDQAATLVAGTVQALPTNTSEPTPETSTELLPQALYYLDGSQVRRMERDGKTNTELTFEPNGVIGFDVSLADGALAFITDNQLVLINADGSDRRVLIAGDPARDERDPRFFKNPLSNPVFSPDGQTIAYNHRHQGVSLYNLATGTADVVVEDDIYVGHSPVSFSPDGKKLLVALGQWENPPAHAVYYPETDELVRISNVPEGMGCCSENGGPVWSPDSMGFYGVASALQTCCQNGELWKVDAGSGAISGSLLPFFEGDGSVDLFVEVYPATNGQLYFFYGTYQRDSGFFAPRALSMARSAPDGITDRTVLSDENFIMMNEALWAPDASLVIVATSPARNWNQDGGVLELYPTDGRKEAVWLAPFGKQLRWGP